MTMKFLNMTETVFEKETLKSDYRQSNRIGRVGIGESVLYFKNKMKINYMPFAEIYRVFRRIKAVPARIGSARSEIRLEFLVLCSKKDEIAEIDLPDENASNAIIEEIQKKNPDLKIGKKKD